MLYLKTHNFEAALLSLSHLDAESFFLGAPEEDPPDPEGGDTRGCSCFWLWL